MRIKFFRMYLKILFLLTSLFSFLSGKTQTSFTEKQIDSVYDNFKILKLENIMYLDTTFKAHRLREFYTLDVSKQIIKIEVINDNYFSRVRSIVSSRNYYFFEDKLILIEDLKSLDFKPQEITTKRKYFGIDSNIKKAKYLIKAAKKYFVKVSKLK